MRGYKLSLRIYSLGDSERRVLWHTVKSFFVPLLAPAPGGFTLWETGRKFQCRLRSFVGISTLIVCALFLTAQTEYHRMRLQASSIVTEQMNTTSTA